jgi:hypothetical protein
MHTLGLHGLQLCARDAGTAAQLIALHSQELLCLRIALVIVSRNIRSAVNQRFSIGGPLAVPKESASWVDSVRFLFKVLFLQIINHVSYFHCVAKHDKKYTFYVHFS